MQRSAPTERVWTAAACALILWSAVGPVSARGQASPDPPLPSCPSTAATLRELLDDSRALIESERFAAAIACLELAVGRGVRETAPDLEGHARLGLAQALYGVGRYPRAGEEAGKAIEIFARAGDALNGARATRLEGSIALMNGERAAARELYRKALAAFESLGADGDRAQTLLALARSSDDEAETVTLAGRVIGLARAAGDKSLEARALHLRSDTEFQLGRFDAAIQDLQAAIALFEELGERNQLADAYVSLGRMHRAHGRPLRAIEYYDRAIALEDAIGDLRGMVQSVNAKAIALAAAGRRDESAREYERAVEIARRTGTAEIVNFAEGNLAAVYRNAGDHARAIELLEAVIERERQPYMLAYRHAALAQSYAATGRIDRAVDHTTRAAAFVRESNNHEYLPVVLHRLGMYERQAGRLDAALIHAREAVAATEALRARLVPLDYLKRGFSNLYQSVFGLTIALLFDAGHAEEALATAEQARARAFVDLLASRDLVSQGDRPAVSLPVPAHDVPLAAYASAAPVSRKEIASAARRLRSAILSYWVGSDEVFAWVATASGEVHAARTPVRLADLEKAVAAAVPSAGAWDAAAHARLHDWLIRPIARWLPAETALTVIPHGVLFRVSFAALADARSVYLIERHAISYAPSISSFALTARMAERTTGTAGHLLVADPTPLPAVEGDPLPALPGTRDEIRAVARILGGPNTLSLAAAAASEPATRRACAGRRVIHFATHAVIRDDAPFESFLALGGSDGDPACDGRLTVRELYETPLDADLVVLSACRSATGPPSGDGITGLGRALFYAGAPSIVATLWDVSDEPSAALLAAFYRAWRGGADKRDALRRAQLQMIRSLRAGRVIHTPDGDIRLTNQPFYWAGYILLGEP
jgi:CHAT domain-containing protein/tetratricopeptide (TPR) repeat protein